MLGLRKPNILSVFHHLGALNAQLHFLIIFQQPHSFPLSRASLVQLDNVNVLFYICVYLLHIGTERHDLTSWTSFDSIFRFFAEVLEAKDDEEAEETSNTVTTRSSSHKNKHQDL